MASNRKILNRLLIALLMIVSTTLAVWAGYNWVYLLPNIPESLALAGGAIVLVLGLALIRRSSRPAEWDSPAHRRYLKAQEQKHREGLPPGQL